MHSLKIHLYTFCYNEERIIPFFLKHYNQFVDRIFVFDNQSNDTSRELLNKSPKVNVVDWDSGGIFRDDQLRNLKNRIWKRSRGIADFVMVLDMDEFIFYDNIIAALVKLKSENYSVIRFQGYEMVSEGFPNKSFIDEVQHGVRNPQYDKMVLLDPNKIENINYSIGAHLALPEGWVKIKMNDPGFKLLHYRFLGIDYLLNKHASRAERLSEINIKNKWSYHFNLPREEQIKAFQKVLHNKVKIL